MKWINHKAITFSTIYLLTSNLYASIVSALGSILPDLVEGFNFQTTSWKKSHRRISHWGFFI